ncbi:MAG: hypothetical protein U1E53_06360 [Dongiaceae bacterium]
MEVFMGASQSNLSGAGYGIDFVLAVTQRSLNATIKSLLLDLKEPIVIFCVCVDDNNKPYVVDYEKLKSNAKGSDPFAISAGADPNVDSDLKNLYDAGFLAAFRARLGIPAAYSDPEVIPDIVRFIDKDTVQFRMMCSEFAIVELAVGRSKRFWTSVSQGASEAWLFSSVVGIRTQVTDPKSGALPPAVAKRADALMGRGETFSVRQFLFDLSTAALNETPTIQGVPPGSASMSLLTQYFVGLYFEELKKRGEPVLGVTITQPRSSSSDLVVTDVVRRICPVVDAHGVPLPTPNDDQVRLATLAYCGEFDGDPLPADAKTFGWNWVESSDTADCHGVVSVSRSALVKHLHSQLLPVATNCSFAPECRFIMRSDGMHFFSLLTPGQVPAVTVPPTGKGVLAYSYHPQTAVGTWGITSHDAFLAKAKLGASYDLTVQFDGSAITIQQHLKIYFYIWSGVVFRDGNIVDRKVTDVFTLSTADGVLSIQPSGAVDDASTSLDLNGFDKWFADVCTISIAQAEGIAKRMTSLKLADIPVTMISDFVFPGGDAFILKDAAFSGSQDLVCRITYSHPK